MSIIVHSPSRVLLAGGLVIAAMWHASFAHAQRDAGLNTVLTFQISAATRVLDLGSSGTPQSPPNWTMVGFDDSAWTPASTASISCTTGDWAGDYQNIGSPTIYWGDNTGDAYLFRLDFGLPAAKSYYGSTLSFSALGGDGNDPIQIYLNGQEVDSGWADFTMQVRDAIGQYLKSGPNVLAISAPAYQDTGRLPCGALAFTITARMTDIQTGSPAPSRAALSVILPGRNAVLSGSNHLPFSWHAFPGASYYYLQIWLAVPAPGQAITARTTTLFSARLTGTRYTLNVRHMARGTYSWRMASVSRGGRMLTGWTPEQSVTLG